MKIISLAKEVILRKYNMANRVKEDDMVKVLVGKDKGAEGKVLEVNHRKSLVLVEGVNVCKIHKKKD